MSAMILFLLAVIICPLAYIELLTTMSEHGIQHAPKVPFFFIFGTLGGWLLAFSLSPGGLCAMCIVFLATAAPLALLVSAIYLTVRSERTLFHKIALGCSYGYSALLALGFIIGSMMK